MSDEKRQVTFDQYLDRLRPQERKPSCQPGEFLRKRVCVSCGKPMAADEFRAEEDRCYWCCRLSRKKS